MTRRYLTENKYDRRYQVKGIVPESRIQISGDDPITMIARKRRWEGAVWGRCHGSMEHDPSVTDGVNVLQKERLCERALSCAGVAYVQAWQ